MRRKQWLCCAISVFIAGILGSCVSQIQPRAEESITQASPEVLPSTATQSDIADATISTEPQNKPSQETITPESQYEIRLGYAEATSLFKKGFDSLSILIDDATSVLDYYSTASFSSVDEVKTYESMWQELSDAATAISSSLTAKLPPKEHEKAWNEYVDCINQIAIVLERGNNLDLNSDGTYTRDEIRSITLDIGETFLDLASQVIDLVKGLNAALSESLVISSQDSINSDENTVTDNTCANNHFTNKYGTPTTKCAHAGCNNYIASSGDTNCCTAHSNRCPDCNKYIDEDAFWCVSCLTVAASPTCEACGKDATYTIVGITGQTEYYCKDHYNELQRIMDALGSR